MSELPTPPSVAPIGCRQPLASRVDCAGLQFAAALTTALGAYLVSCWLVPMQPTPAAFGAQWMEMSKDPFALYGQFPHRLLGPLLAWALGCGGEHFLGFVCGLNVLLLTMVGFFCLRRGGAFVDAVLITLAVALTAPVQMYKEHWVGYVDPLCYSLFFASMLTARWPWLFWSLFLANLLNHELAAFLLPWLWFLRRREDRRWRADLIGAGVALALYAGFYLLVKAKAQPTYSSDYFFSHPLFPGGTLVVWCLAVVHWVVGTGPLLAMLAAHQRRPGERAERWQLWLVLLGILSIFGIAFDWQRHSNLLVLPFVLASTRFLAGGARQRWIFAALLVVSAALFLVPTWRPWSPTAWPTCVITEPQVLVRTGILVNLAPDGAPVDFGFGPLRATVQNWLPEAWPVLLPTFGLLALFLGLGWWLARRAPAPLAQPAPHE
ncbi:MAG: hypothetical protein K8J09_14240 [Planctomycetes bacterium]|nr:hypothetical protein [Planctomycetota bacterium]MCC7398959.1 hypothetical protein [Planctomycetota bacterium]